MKNKTQQPFSTHFLAAIGCVLLLAGTASAAESILPGQTIRHTSAITQSLDGKIQHTFRKIRHLVHFFLDKNEIVKSDQQIENEILAVSVALDFNYQTIFAYRVSHLKIREIKTRVLRV
jgi:hypothetical protein